MGEIEVVNLFGESIVYPSATAVVCDGVLVVTRADGIVYTHDMSKVLRILVDGEKVQ